MLNEAGRLPPVTPAFSSDASFDKVLADPGIWKTATKGLLPAALKYRTTSAIES